ncbi:MAG: aminopeptidase P family protein [Lachnospiraceae bacterium]|nr:aminopeptidase P family protein [Lachnospiraceae bacterium]
MARAQIEALRKAMREAGVSVCLVPTADAHESEYPAEYFEARKYLSGFTGSAGILAVTEDWAGLFTDGRYFLQAERQLAGSGITLYKTGEEGVPSVEEELSVRFPEGGVLAFDGTTVNRRFGELLGKLAKERNGSVLLADLPGRIWKKRPPLKMAAVFPLKLCYAGESRREKFSRVRQQMGQKHTDLHVVTTLDDIAWLMNLRGRDIACNPVFLSYLVLSMERAWLFAGEEALSEAVKRELSEDLVTVRPYGAFFGELPALCQGKTVLADSRKVSEQVWEGLSRAKTIVDSPNPSIAMKAVKNPTEEENFRKAHRKDGVAVTKFLYWLKKNIGRTPITEGQAAAYLETCRRKQKNYLGPSFPTIAAYGANGAQVHYQPEGEGALLSPEGFLLVDSGGHYLEGTTDITRTVALGPLTKGQKRHFTAVLKGMLALGDAKFPQGLRGSGLDCLARGPLWAMGLDYLHGTGHGVGYLLNVHEGPNGFRWRQPPEGAETAILAPGMITSDEPGFYLEGEYGIRTENLLLCRKGEKNRYGQFLEFEHLTLAPIDLEAVDWEEMDGRDVQRLNVYHRQVRSALAPHLEGDELQWFLDATETV